MLTCVGLAVAHRFEVSKQKLEYVNKLRVLGYCMAFLFRSNLKQQGLAKLANHTLFRAKCLQQLVNSRRTNR